MMTAIALKNSSGGGYIALSPDNDQRWLAQLPRTKDLLA